MIEVDGLRKEYNGFPAVEGSTFTVNSGEVLGLIGPNGAGKTTTIKMLAGLIEPTAGNATVAGYSIRNPDMKQELGFLPEESPLYDEMTPISYLRFFADLYNIPQDTADKRIHETLDRLDLDIRTRAIGNLSKGMKRKVAIARSLVNDPEVLIYDEPASGLDPVTTNEIIEFTRDLAEDGKTILFSAHNLHHVESVCDRVAMMNDGEIITEGTLAEIRSEHSLKEYKVTANVPIPAADQIDDSTYVKIVDTMDGVEKARKAADTLDGRITDIQTRNGTLEDIFLELSGNNPTEETSTPS